MPYNCPYCKKELADGAKICPHCNEMPGSDIPDNFVTIEGRYEIISTIKTGAMGCVYKARDNRLDTIVAVKKMKSFLTTPEEKEYSERRFKDEAKILSSLHHGGLPKVIDYFTAPDFSSGEEAHYLVMTFIEGKDFESVLNERNQEPLPFGDVIDYFYRLLEILSYLHSHVPPIIYRDLKPSNIMINEDKVFLVDFGIARIFTPQQKGTAIGTPGYAPPEQYKGFSEPRSDIYSLGVLIHYMLTGVDPEDSSRPPFTFDPPRKLNKIIPEYLDRIIVSMLDLNIEKRPHSVKRILQMLDRGDAPDERKSIIDNTHSNGTRSSALKPVRIKLFAVMIAVISGIMLLSYSFHSRMKNGAHQDKLFNLPGIGFSLKEQVITLEGHAGPISSIAFSPNGRYLASCSSEDKEKSIILWDLKNKTCIWSNTEEHYKYCCGNILSVAFSPDNKYVASSDLGCKMILWDTVTGKELKTCEVKYESYSSTVFSHDGRYVVCGGGDRINIWDFASDRLSKIFDERVMICKIVISRDGRYIGYGGSLTAVIDVMTGRHILDFKVASNRAFDMSPDGKYIAYGCWNSIAKKPGGIRINNIGNSELITTIDTNSNILSSLSYSHDGKYIASASYKESSVKVFDVASGESVKTFTGHSGIINTAVFSPDDKYIASGGYDRTIKIWCVH